MRIELRMRVKGGYPMKYEEIQRGWKDVGSTVVESLNSVRDLKRYLNLMIPRYNWMLGKVDCRDYFLLYLLCYKDFGLYLALHSRRILQLDVPTQTYVLIPNYEEELKQVSQWRGSKSILERLFAPIPEGEESVPRRLSLRNVSGFDTYFRGFNFLEGRLYGPVLLEIIHSMRTRTLLNDIDDLLKNQEVGHVVETFFYLVNSPCRRGEDRAEAIKAMAYLALVKGLPEDKVATLRADLLDFLSRDRYSRYKELGVIQDLDAYKLLLEPMLNFVVQENPEWVSSIINRLSQEESLFATRCIYSIEELSKLLSDHQKS